MKANELMVGDWVKIKGQKCPKRISCIDEYVGSVDFWDDENLIITSIKNVLPLPLTDEILEKNFSSTDKVGWNADGKGYWITEAPLETNPQVNIKLHYVHELQHALRLCGVKKEIQL